MTGSIMALTARGCLPLPPAALRAAARRRYAALRATLGAALRAAQNVPNTENAPILVCTRSFLHDGVCRVGPERWRCELR